MCVRFVLSLIMANLMSAVVSIPGHVYQLLIKPEQHQQAHRQHHQHHHEFHEGDERRDGSVDGDGVNTAGLGAVTWLERLAEEPHTWFSSWYWHKQGLDGLTVLVSLASVLSILLISLDRYYVRYQHCQDKHSFFFLLFPFWQFLVDKAQSSFLSYVI